MRKINIAVLSVLCVLVIAGVAAYVWVEVELRRSLPQLSGVITLEGISEQVVIYRDEYGIPHIHAQNRGDLMFAVGYVSAQDRLWQMDVTRRAATGRLAEIFGERLIEADLLVRILGLEHTAKRQLTLLSPDTLAALRAFSDGVNASMERLSALPPEFRLLKYRPEPWQPSDALAISRLLAWQLSKDFESELILGRVAAKLGEGVAAELAPTYPSDGPFIIPAGEFDRMDTAFLERSARVLKEFVGHPGGSNSWVIGPAWTRSGAPILANDPHLNGTRMPSIWYYVHLVGGGYDVIGALAPGMPLPIIGHNRRIGWGLTNMTADIQDIFVERLNPNDPLQYEYDGRWVDMDTRLERIGFRTEEGGLSVIARQVRRTIHGPLMNDVTPGVSHAISLCWTGFEPTADFEALPGVCLARNWKEFRRALNEFGAAPQNFIYADIDGNIGYQGAGIVPIRSGGSSWMPREGWKSERMWSGRIPFEQMPSVLNPRAGYIVTANNRVVGDEYPHFISAYWAPRFRYERIAELIESDGPYDTNSVARMQSDSVSLLAPLMLGKVMPALSSLDDPVEREAGMMLRQWDYKNTTDSVAATIYHEFMLNFAMNTFADEMGRDLAERYLSEYYLWLERFVKLMEEDSRWFDDRGTEALESRDDVALRSFRETVASLKRRLGKDVSEWKWGKVHTVEFRHPLESNRLARWLFNVGPFPFPGDGETVNRATFAFDKPYDVTMVASIRHVMDFSQLERTLGIHTTGQSGSPASRHYSDFTARWLAGEYITLTMDAADYGDADKVLTLAPKAKASGSQEQ
ncbi:MAG: penicillin acylase family protein [Candidatus Abyssubacteria bacterium]